MHKTWRCSWPHWKFEQIPRMSFLVAGFFISLGLRAFHSLTFTGMVKLSQAMLSHITIKAANAQGCRWPAMKTRQAKPKFYVQACLWACRIPTNRVSSYPFHFQLPSSARFLCASMRGQPASLASYSLPSPGLDRQVSKEDSKKFPG